MGAIFRILGVYNRHHRNLDRGCFYYRGSKMKEVTIGETRCPWEHVLESGGSENRN
jgi:hypothetical protein